jgi:hypothetical protein
MLPGIDPSELASVFRLMEASDSETRWTVWLCSMLSASNGEQLVQLTWRTLTDAIIASGVARAVAPDYPLADLVDWQVAGEQMPFVDREVADPAWEGEESLGRLDLVIQTDTMFIVLENKLDEGWHDHDDGEGKQAIRYRNYARKHHGTRRIGLVLLTNRGDFKLEPEFCDYVRIDYRQLAKALRRRLREALAGASKATTLALGPALLTVAAIEKDLLNLDLATLRAASSWRDLEKVNAAAIYLQEDA